MRTLRFTGSLGPTRELALDGRIWLVGSAGTGCAVEELDPASLATRSYPLTECPTGYVAAGAGHLYLLVVHGRPTSNDEELHVETFDTTTGRSGVMAPVAATTVGSGLAHMTLLYGLGWLWLYPWGDRVLRISPSSGAVAGSVGGVTSGGGHAVMAAEAAHMWLAEGPGGQHLFRFTAASATASRVYRVPDPGSLVWVAAAGGRIWAEVATYSGTAGSVTTTRLVAFDGAGHRLFQNGPEAVGEAGLVEAGGQLWSAGLGTSCWAPLRLWRVQPGTGHSALAAVLGHGQTCVTAGDVQMAAAGGYVFVLDPAASGSGAGVLYRIRP